MPGTESQKKGKILEEALASLITRLLIRAGCEIVEGPRIEPVGSQHGRDIVIRFRYPSSAHIWTVVFECKNQSKGKLRIDDFAGKPYQVSASGLDIDSWVVVAPHVCLATEAYDYLPQLQSQFPFYLSILTPEQKVEEFFALEPDLYETIYEKKPDILSDSARWQEWLVDTLDKLGYLQGVVSRSMPTMEVIHPGGIEKKRESNEKHRQKLAQEFYRGQIPEWKHIATDLDFRRFVASKQLAELRQVAQEQGGVHLILALSEAGAGKSTFLMREALEAAKAGAIVLYSGGLPRENLVNTLVTTIRSIQDRARSHPVLLILDNAASIAEQLREVLLSFYTAGQPFIVLVADRFNRWRDAVGEQALEEGTTARFPGKTHYLMLSKLDNKEQREFISKIKQFSISPKVVESSDDELISLLEHNYKGQLVVFLLELLEGKHFEAIVRDEAADFEVEYYSMGMLYRAVAAFHRFGVDIPEAVILRFLNVTTGAERQHYRDAFQAAREGHLLRVDQFNQMSTRHELIAQALFEGLDCKAQKDLLIDLIAAVDPNEQSEVSALATILVDPSRRSDVWVKPYRRALYEAAMAKLPDAPRFWDVALLLGIHEDNLESAHDILKEQRSVISLQNLARAELKKGHRDIAHALYCEAIGLPANVSDEQMLSLTNTNGEIERSLIEGRTDNIAVTEFARFLSTRKNHIAIALLECLNRCGKADAHSIHLLARCFRKASGTDEAVELLSGGRERFPEDAPVFSLDLINLLKNESRDDQKIEAAYQEAIERGWADAHVYTSYAHFVKKIRGGEAAIDVFQAGMSDAPDPTLCLQFASLLQDLGRDERAEEILRQGIKLFPLDNAMYTELGRLLKQRGQVQEVVNVFQIGLRLCPTSAHLHTEYALLLEKQGKLDQAEEVFRDGIKVAPLNGPIYNALGRFLEKHGGVMEAEKVLKKGFEQALIRPESTLHELARFLDRHGQQPEAETLYKLGMVRFPWHHHFYVDYGLHLQNQKRFRAALHCYRRGMEITKNRDAPLAQVLGRLLMRMWRYEEAIDAFKIGLEATEQVADFDKRAKQRAAIFKKLVLLHWYRGQFKQGEQVARQGIEACPKEPLLYINLAIILRSQGKSSSAKDCLSNALNLTNDEKERQRILETFSNTFRLNKSGLFKVVKTDVRGRINSIIQRPPNPYGFVTSDDGNKFYFRLLDGAKFEHFPLVKLCEFDVIEYPNGMRRANYVEVIDWEL